MHQQPRGGGSFSEGILNLDKQELVSAWDKRTRRLYVGLHPTYSLYLAPLDYYLFQSIAYFLWLQYFNNKEEVEASVKEFLTSKNKNWYQHGIKELADYMWGFTPHSLYLAPLDYYLFQSMAYFLWLQYFNNKEEVEASVKEFLTLKNKNCYQCGESAERWFLTVQHDDLNFEC